MDSSLFKYSHQELKFLVTQFSAKREIVIDVHERFLLYEAYKRYIEKSEFYTMKWAEQSLRLSFPKIYSMVDKLVNLGYLKRARSTKDKRIVYLEPTEKLILGIELYESMKLNELNALGITTQKVANRPNFSELNQSTASMMQDLFLTKDRK